VKSRAGIVILVVLGLAGAAVYARRKRAAAAPPPVRLGLADGGELSLAADDPGVADLRSAAADVRRAFEKGV
jgi:hypothetical protein